MSGEHSTPEAIAKAELLSTTPPRGDAFALFSQLTFSPNPPDMLPITSLQPAQPPYELPFAPLEPIIRPANRPASAPPSLPTLTPLRLDTPDQPLLFDTWNHISSIFRSNDPNGPGESVYEALQGCNVDFFLPQLCLLLIHLPSRSHHLERIVLDRCSKSLHFAARSIFCLGALAPPPGPEPTELAERIENYRYACQLAFISGERPNADQDAVSLDSSHANGSAESSNLSSDSQSPQRQPKDLRFRYMWSLKRFLRELSDIGHDLMKAPEGGRSAALRSRLSLLNEQLRQSALEPESARYSLGLFLPLAPHDDLHYACVRIPEHEATTLPSRNRVPFSFCFESISQSASSLRLCDENVESLIDSYVDRVRSLLTTPNGTPRASSSISLSTLSTSSPYPSSPSTPTGIPTSPFSSSEGIAIQQRPRVSTDFSSSTPPPPELQHLLSVPQNIKAIQTKERWSAKEARIRAHSRFGSEYGWKLRSVIVKYGVDGLQEQLSLQLLRLFSYIFETTNEVALLKPYDCLVIDGDASLIEPLLNAESIHQLKKHNNCIPLNEYFIRKWRGPDSPEFEAAQRTFMRTLIGSSVICYLLQLKDRHNGNIMIDDEGSIVHIDWGFLLWNTPGAIGFETAPFKLTLEMVAVLGGVDSSLFQEFKTGFYNAFISLRRHSQQIIDLIKIMFLCDPVRVPCAQGGQTAVDALVGRFSLQLSEEECRELTDGLITQSYNNWRTTNYDYFQYYSNGILS